MRISGKNLEKKIFLAAHESNKLIGSVRAKISDDNSCYIGRLIVHPDFQNQGIGTQLMNEIEKYYPGAKRFELFTGYKSEKNIYLYKKIGYQIIREIESDMNIRLVIMEKLQ